MTPVSIVITAHNYAKFLAQALDSALAQTHPRRVRRIASYLEADRLAIRRLSTFSRLVGSQWMR